MKGRALRRALQTKDLVRIHGDIPLLVDDTELISPARAYELLETNKHNRPINWQRVEAYAAIMRRGEWKVHGQGLLLDVKGNILTGQHRLWGIIYADVEIPMRVSRGNPEDVASVIDRGIPQSARDLATRQTCRKHSPVEASIGRAILAIGGCLRPTVDALSEVIVTYQPVVSAALSVTKGTKKTRAVLMTLAAICRTYGNLQCEEAMALVLEVDRLSAEVTTCSCPQTPESCWGRGAAFGLAMTHAMQVVSTHRRLLRRTSETESRN